MLSHDVVVYDKNDKKANHASENEESRLQSKSTHSAQNIAERKPRFQNDFSRFLPPKQGDEWEP